MDTIQAISRGNGDGAIGYSESVLMAVKDSNVNAQEKGMLCGLAFARRASRLQREYVCVYACVYVA